MAFTVNPHEFRPLDLPIDEHGVPAIKKHSRGGYSLGAAVLRSGANINVWTWTSFNNPLTSRCIRNTAYCSNPYVGHFPISVAHHSIYPESDFGAPVPGGSPSSLPQPSEPSWARDLGK